MVKFVMIAAVALAVVGALFLYGNAATASMAWGGPDKLEDTVSFVDRIKGGKTLHVMYVHGMRASKAGASEPLIALLTSRLGFRRDGGSQDETFTIAPWPQGAKYLDEHIWKNQEEWDASRPFVLRHTLVRDSDQARIVIDEVNWWPLLFPLKCRFLIKPEHDLSGNDEKHIELCSRDAPADHYYPWLSEKDREWLRGKPKGGGAALGNRLLKQQIMNWGLSDAVIVSGPMRIYANAAMDKAFDFARQGAGPDDSFVVMSESLGSFVVMDAMALGSEAVTDVLERTNDLYFFANQFALLELSRISGLPKHETLPAALEADGPKNRLERPETPLDALKRWGASRPAGDARTTKSRLDRPRQIIAFSDPSDLLTYVVPRIEGVKVVNLYDRNATRWFGLIEDPAKAHTGHLRNKAVWRILTRH